MQRSLLTLLALALTYSTTGSAGEQTWVEPLTGMVFVKIEAECFQMGTAEHITADPGGPLVDHPAYRAPISSDEVPVHEVCLSPYWISRHEVRLADWKQLYGVYPTGIDDNVLATRPVSRVNWQQANAFAARLSQSSDFQFRLPTEAEWEHACRAGFEKPLTAHSTGLVHLAWYNRGDARRTEPQPVGELEPNAFGLYDMMGNVWEWTLDSYHPDAYQRHDTQDPVVSDSAQQKVMRGGSFRSEPKQTRCTVRGHLPANQLLTSVGFRLVRQP